MNLLQTCPMERLSCGAQAEDVTDANSRTHANLGWIPTLKLPKRHHFARTANCLAVCTTKLKPKGTEHGLNGKVHPAAM